MKNKKLHRKILGWITVQFFYEGYMDHLISVRPKRSWPAVHVPQGSA